MKLYIKDLYFLNMPNLTNYELSNHFKHILLHFVAINMIFQPQHEFPQSRQILQ